MSEYGIPYMGSKAKHIERFGFVFPKAEHFYDVFGGGFAVSHYMLARRFNHYSFFHYNEIRKGMGSLISKAINGEYSYKKFKMPWISREEFFAKKETDPFIKTIWSFGNNGKNYLFSKEIESYKRSLHECVVFDLFDETTKKITGLSAWPDAITTKGKRLFIRNRIAWMNRGMRAGELQQLQQLQQLERLQQLEQLERLQQLEHKGLKQKLVFHEGDYRDIRFEKNCVIYCDPPYKGAAEYDDDFNHNEFLEWAHSQTCPVFISEYKIDDPRFPLILEWKTKSLLSSNGQTSATERLYGNKAAFEHNRLNSKA